MNILIVDDQSTNRKLLRVQLEAEEFCVVEAADGVAAMEVMARVQPDAVISDIFMPRMDGFRLCQEVRKSPVLREMRFILYSSTYTSQSDVQLCNTVGADQFIAKPASIAVILGALLSKVPGEKARTAGVAHDAVILQQYSSVLVAKLEEKNNELQQALAESRRSHAEIQELNTALERRVRERTAELKATNDELTTALAEVKQLNQFLPICSYCKNIRDDKDYWESVEGYISRHTDSKFSHGICPDCYEKHVTPMLANLGLPTVAKTCVRKP